jgi:hypothetical protein
MPRAFSSIAAPTVESHTDAPAIHAHGRQLSCQQCEHPLECVEQNRRAGSWLGSYVCPNCRSEYFYAYRWGRLVRRS